MLLPKGAPPKVPENAHPKVSQPRSESAVGGQSIIERHDDGGIIFHVRRSRLAFVALIATLPFFGYSSSLALRFGTPNQMIQRTDELHVPATGPCPPFLSIPNTGISNTGFDLRRHLLPPGAIFGRICRYTMTTRSRLDRRRAAVISGRTTVDFQKVIGRMERSPSRTCSQVGTNVTIFAFGYSNGRSVDLRFVESGVCESLTNGHLTASLTNNAQWFSDLGDLVNLLTLRIGSWRFEQTPV